MVHSSGTCWGNSGKGMNMGVDDEMRKTKRKESNRESARRSRLRKQKHVDNLRAKAAHLQKQNHEVSINLSTTKQINCDVEIDNSILKAQLIELSNRLQSLQEILNITKPDHHQFQGWGEPNLFITNSLHGVN